MKKTISFIHAADLHIDAPFKGMANVPKHIFEAAKDSTFRAFDKLIRLAIQKKVDFVLVVGDLFDQENQSLQAQIHVRNGFRKLEEHQIKVYMSYGNHDFISGNKFPVEYPSNVHIFPDEHISSFVYEREGESVAEIYGFSYENRAVTENKLAQYVKGDPSIPYHIATLHGSLSSNTEHDPYAPFTIQEMKEKGFDYWALGHIHKRQKLSDNPPIVYPGNIQGRHRHETGEKGCYYTVMDGGDISMEFVPLQSILFTSQTLDISSAHTATELEALLDQIQVNKEEQTFQHVTLRSKNEASLQLEAEGIIDDLILLWNEHHTAEAVWQYIYDYQFIWEETYEQDQFFLKDLQETLMELDINEVISPLWSEQQIRKFATKVDEKEVVDEAEKLLHYYFKHH